MSQVPEKNKRKPHNPAEERAKISSTTTSVETPTPTKTAKAPKVSKKRSQG